MNSIDFFYRNPFFTEICDVDRVMQGVGEPPPVYIFNKRSSYAEDMYQCFRWAGITDEMIFGKDIGMYSNLESLTEYSALHSDPYISVLNGDHLFAYKYADHREYGFYKRLIKEGCREFFDTVTDFGRNDDYARICRRMLINEYLRDGDDLCRFASLYPEKYSEAESALDRVILGAGSADKIFKQIAEEVYDIYFGFTKNVTDFRGFNGRVIKIIERCAVLCMKLTDFGGFDSLLLPGERRFPPEGGCDRSTVVLPQTAAELIGENTAVYTVFYSFGARYFLEGNDACQCCFCDGEDMKITEYIAKYYFEKYGHRLTVKISDIAHLTNISEKYSAFVEFDFQNSFLDSFYNGFKNYRYYIIKGSLSQKNIDEITAYFISRMNDPNADKKGSLLKLRQLYNALDKAGGDKK